MSTLYSIQYAIQQALNNSIVDAEVIYRLLGRGDRTINDILPLYEKRGGAIDTVIYNIAYKILVNQHIQRKMNLLASSMPMPPTTKGGRRRRVRKTKRSRK
jgi:hypothetical protein